MNMFENAYMGFSGITAEEISFLQQATAELSENQNKNFMMIYSGKRKNPQDILLVTLLGFVGIAGVQRFITNQVGMGLLYFFTAGFCFIGTIVDLINSKTIANDFNKQMAYESFQIAKMSN